MAYNEISHSRQNICKLLADMKENLSQLVDRRLRELGISKSDLAATTGLSRAYITDIANGTGNTQSGQYRPSPNVVAKLAKALEIDEAEILIAIGYQSGLEKDESHEIFEGVSISFQEAAKVSKKEQEQIRDAVKLIIKGVKPDVKEKEKKSSTGIGF